MYPQPPVASVYLKKFQHAHMKIWGRRTQNRYYTAVPLCLTLCTRLPRSPISIHDNCRQASSACSLVRKVFNMLLKCEDTNLKGSDKSDCCMFPLVLCFQNSHQSLTKRQVTRVSMSNACWLARHTSFGAHSFWDFASVVDLQFTWTISILSQLHVSLVNPEWTTRVAVIFLNTAQFTRARSIPLRKTRNHMSEQEFYE